MTQRFNVGIRNVTIPNPAVFTHFASAVPFEGATDKYDFEKQTLNYQMLQEILRRNGRRFSTVHSLHYKGDLHTNHRFVVLTDDNSLLWHKYVGFVAQSGQNHVFVAGRRIKVSCFVQFSPGQQTALLEANEDHLAWVFPKNKLAYFNEDKQLWN